MKENQEAELKDIKKIAKTEILKLVRKLEKCVDLPWNKIDHSYECHVQQSDHI
jgi:hypothetical protein